MRMRQGDSEAGLIASTGTATNQRGDEPDRSAAPFNEAELVRNAAKERTSI